MCLLSNILCYYYAAVKNHLRHLITYTIQYNYVKVFHLVWHCLLLFNMISGNILWFNTKFWLKFISILRSHFYTTLTQTSRVPSQSFQINCYYWNTFHWIEAVIYHDVINVSRTVLKEKSNWFKIIPTFHSFFK